MDNLIDFNAIAKAWYLQRAQVGLGCNAKDCDHDYKIQGTEPCGGREVLKCSICGNMSYRERCQIGVRIYP